MKYWRENWIFYFLAASVLIAIIIVFYSVSNDNKRKDWCREHGYEVFETRNVFCVDDQHHLILPAR